MLRDLVSRRRGAGVGLAPILTRRKKKEIDIAQTTQNSDVAVSMMLRKPSLEFESGPAILPEPPAPACIRVHTFPIFLTPAPTWGFLTAGSLRQKLSNCHAPACGNTRSHSLRIDSSKGPLIFHCERSASDSPLGRRLCWNIPRCSVTDPSEEGWTIEAEQCQKIGHSVATQLQA
jgi:hypothetical protein